MTNVEDNPAKILIVDDDPAIGIILEGYLKPDNYQICLSDNGEEAIKKVKELGPDLVVLDVMMPGISGFDVCESLKNDEATRDIPVLFMTSLSDRDSHKKAIECGAEGFILKPFDEDLIRACVKTFVRMKKANDRARQLSGLDPEFMGMPGTSIHIGDVTEKKKIEDHLIRANRLSTLAVLSSGIAHEIRNPLSSISLFLDILSDKERFDPTTEEVEIMDEIRDNVDRMTVIIRRMLDYARSPKKTTTELNLNNLIREEIKLWSMKIKGSGVDLELVLENDIPPVQGDSIELRQVINNLIQNSLEAIEAGGALSITTTSGISSCHKDWQAVIVKVKDTGPGIRPELRENIFKPFFTTKTGGTGLGLAIIHRIIEDHKGLISCDSVPGQGTTFTIELPCLSTG